MTVPRFFTRVHAAVGRHLAVDRATLDARLQEVTVGVQCASSSDQNAYWTAELLVNQFARLYPRLCIFGDEGTAASLRDLARWINPTVDLIEDPTRATTTVSTCPIGPAGALVAGALVAGAAGWSAIIGEGFPSKAGAPNPIAAGAAAALAASAVFRRILLDNREPWGSTRLNLITFDSGTDDSEVLARLDVGQLLVAGVGAVGNAALWVLRRHPNLAGHATIVDPETVELSNLQRYVLTGDSDVGQQKTHLAYRALKGTDLSVAVLAGRLGAIAIPTDIENTLVTVDNVPGRRAAQALLPKLVISGWTSESGLGASWHDFHEGRACLSCLYQPHGPTASQTEIVARALGLSNERAALLWITPERLNKSDIEIIASQLNAEHDELSPWIGRRLQDAYTKLVCGSAAISIGDRGRIETVPLTHQSVFAGVLAAAELVKRLDPTLAASLPRQNLVAWHDVTRPPPQLWVQHRSPEPGCICGDSDYREVFRTKWSAQSP